jgi:hypothetical protein
MKLTHFFLVFALILGMGFLPIDADAQTKKRTTRKRATKPKPKVTTPKVIPALVPFAGTWFPVDAEGKFQKANRIVLSSNGIFRYVGPGWTSEGTYSLAETGLNFTWTKIDGQAVKPGTVKKMFPLAEDRKSFQLDRFKYTKS